MIVPLAQAVVSSVYIFDPIYISVFSQELFDFEIPFDIETDCSNTVRVFNLDIYNQSVILAFTFVWITKPFLVFTAQSAFNAVIFANCAYCVVAGDAADTSIT